MNEQLMTTKKCFFVCSRFDMLRINYLHPGLTDECTSLFQRPSFQAVIAIIPDGLYREVSSK
jgi:hypothetical protein